MSGSEESKLEGSRVIFRCSVEGYPMNENLVWMHDGTEVINSSSRGSIINISANLTSTYSTLTLEKITHKQNGSYSCRYGKQTSKIEFRVIGKPIRQLEFGIRVLLALLSLIEK